MLHVLVDNEFIQRYRGELGTWLPAAGTTLSRLALQNGTSVDAIKSLNPGGPSYGYLFVPMGEEKYHALIEAGKGRRIFEIEANRLIWPLENVSYTSRFGHRNHEMHEGLDLGAARNSVVLAAANGVVERLGYFGALGNAVVVRHPDGFETTYGHNTSILVRVGDTVERGQALAFSGSTGRSTGPHVHFEVRYMYVAMNPEDFLPLGYYRPALIVREGGVVTERVAARRASGLVVARAPGAIAPERLQRVPSTPGDER